MEVMELFTPLVPHEMAGRLKNKKAVQDYVFAGNATITIVNMKNGIRFTYKIKESKTVPGKFYVKTLRGPKLYMAMGVIIGNERKYYLPFEYKKKVDMARKNFAALHPGNPFPEKLYAQQHMPPSLKMFIKFLDWYKSNGETIQNHEIWHEGTCGKCGRKLTVPNSIDVGIGPECLKQLKRNE